MTPLTPSVVTALAQQAAESPAHLDPHVVQQVCQEWLGHEAAMHAVDGLIGRALDANTSLSGQLNRSIAETYNARRRAEQAESALTAAQQQIATLTEQREAALAERDKFHRAYTEVNARSTDAVIAQGERVSRIEAERDHYKGIVEREGGQEVLWLITRDATVAALTAAQQQIATLTEQIEAARRKLEWQPIDTAPRDGREVILAVAMCAGIPHGVLVGHYMPGGHCIEDHPAIDDGWYFWNGCMFDKAATPTHWMAMRCHPDAAAWQRARQREGAIAAVLAQEEVGSENL